MRKLLLILFTMFIFIISCGSNSSNSVKKEKLKVAATAIPAGEVLEVVKEDLLKEGIDMEIIIFNDYIQPNKVLQSKEVDVNLFQHVPYMENFAKKHGFEMVSVGKIYLPTLALYSKKIKNISELKNGDTILLPNDPTNLARSLILLDKSGIIKLSDNKKMDSTLKDIVENPKNIKFNELSAEQLAPRLPEVAASIVNSSFALDAGLSYKEDGILAEGKDSPYANALVTLKGNENDQKIQKLLKALQSEKVKKFIEEKYKDVIVPVF
ncbi:MAG: methionine ABC transporter substrate-binding protein [Leptotrichiaceae bacterium]|nr:methionine ABC transporter substrate-binding protein [Leptotrichiaceae bacterium]MBP6280841.1 methionine ABC transporter substrate-binding protein [Leptotrichiaceae bacterium]MBP7100526.1 methionine ABC transporter substrate-binding protein [Leptotrichiaceae bacterium]MBP7739331.1 methionine ABC transporter substrate-binding protein [Leptotrichiaceae bacterium]MBP9629319.1 methionine ABC transporter substrate-binding protein [Leptotrichiaceae bacterium]